MWSLLIALWCRQRVNRWIWETAVEVLILSSWAVWVQRKRQKRAGWCHTSALFCLVSTDSWGCESLRVSSMLTSFNLRLDTSSIKSSFCVSREVLLISSWGKHTFDLWVSCKENDTQTVHTLKNGKVRIQLLATALWELSMLLHSVQRSSHTSRATGGPRPHKAKYTHSYTQTGERGTLLIYFCASLVWARESMSKRERERGCECPFSL